MVIGSRVSTVYDDGGDLAVRGGGNTSNGAAPIYIVNELSLNNRCALEKSSTWIGS